MTLLAANPLRVSGTCTIQPQVVETQLPLLEAWALSSRGDSPKSLFMIGGVVKHNLRKSHQSRKASFHPPATSFKAKRHSIEATLDIQARARRDEPTAADRQFLPSHPEGEFAVITGLFFPFEESLMHVQ